MVINYNLKGARSEKALKYCYIVLYLLCHIHVDLLKKILLRTEHMMCYIKELRNMSAYNILISSLCFVLSPSSLWSLSLSTHMHKQTLAETPMCAQAKTNLWENTFDYYCPTFSHHLLSPSVPSSFPSMQTLLGCRECTLSKSRDKFKPRYERELPNNHWHTDIQRGGGGALGTDEKAWTESSREQQGGGTSHF